MFIKHSRQRDAIINELKSRKDHPTADEIYAVVRLEYPNISLGTVYRNLSAMAESGEILRLHSSAGADRFDFEIKPHYHFRCTKCGSVSDVDVSVSAKLDDMAQQKTGGNVLGHLLMFYGICKNCNNKAPSAL